MSQPDLEEQFVMALARQNIGYNGKIINMQSSTLLADYVFRDNIVIATDKLTAKNLKIIADFKEEVHTHKIIVLTKNAAKYIDDKNIDELYDADEIPRLIVKLKTIMRSK